MRHLTPRQPQDSFTPSAPYITITVDAIESLSFSMYTYAPNDV